MIIKTVIMNQNEGADFEFHSESMPYFLLVVFKTQALVLENDKFVSASPFNFIIYPKGAKARYKGIGNDFIHTLVGFLPESKEDEELMRRLPFNKIIVGPCVNELLSVIQIAEFEFNAYSFEKEKILSKIGQLILMKAHGVTVYDKFSASFYTSESYKKTLDTRMYIMKNPTAELSVDILAKMANLSRSYYQHLYKKMFGFSCVSDIIKSKIAHAEFILLYSNTPINAVAEMLGYKNVEYFSRLFKRELGHSPDIYRKAMKKSSM